MSLNSLDFTRLMGDEHHLAVEITNDWVSWDTAKQGWRDRRKELDAYLIATDTKTTSNNKVGFSHNTHRPKLTQISDNLKANYMSGLLPGSDWLDFESSDKTAETAHVKQNLINYIKTKHRLSGFRMTLEKLIEDYVDRGNAFCITYYENKLIRDPQSGVVVSGYRGPRIDRIDPEDIVFNPLATSFIDTPKIIRSTKTLGSLRREIEERPDMMYQEEIFTRIVKDRQNLSTIKTEDINKHFDLTPAGFGSFDTYIKSGYVELLDFYGDIYDQSTETFYKNAVITVVDRRYIIRNQALETWTGRPHIYHAGWRNRKNNLWAMGPLENLVGLQYRIDHLENGKADAFDAMMFPDRVFVGDVEVVKEADGSTTYDIPSGQGRVDYLRPDTTVLNADFQIQSIEDSMELYAGSPREAMGFRTPGEKTKFEVAQLATASSRIYQDKMRKFEEELLEPAINGELEVSRVGLGTNTDTIEIIDPSTGAKDFQDITRDDLMASGRFSPIGSRHYAEQQKLAQDLLQFSQGPLQDPKIAQHFPTKRLAKRWEQVLGLTEFDLYEEFGRIPEELEEARLRSAASNMHEAEQSVDLEELNTPNVLDQEAPQG